MSATEVQDLLARREQLRARSARLREQIAQRAQVMRPALHLADRVRAGAGWARGHRAWLALAGAAVLGALAARPRHALSLGLRVWSGWQLLRRVRPVLALFGRR
ncbi:MAG: hypothetical protein LBI48_08785 [Burkholderiaceae bacterium]|jgi:hypothetical protein|nr:hypothetical protein [Burkholderiaceae bacterium]